MLKPCRDIKREVLRTEMQEGIDKCKENITDYIGDARIIAKTGRIYHALISLEFALEEFGKMLLLKDLLVKAKNDLIVIDGYEFCNHNRKVDRALAKIDPNHKFRVLFEGLWARGFWEAGMWAGETLIGNETRLACCFVDFIDNKWTLGRDINSDYFEDLAKIIEVEISKV